jgi:two-component system, NtrC family, sensor kinase
MTETLNILLVDDNPADRTLVSRELRKSFEAVDIQQIVNAEQLELAIQKGEFDVAIIDFALGWTNGLAILQTLKARCPEVPVIMFTATARQEDAIASMKAGLDDYVVKSPKHLSRLPVAIRAVLEQKRQRAVLRQSQKLAILGRLTATVIHEIANPLESLNSILYLIQNAPLQPGEANAYAETGITELKRIQDIMNRTLGFHRQASSPVPVSLTSIVDDVVGLYTKRMEAANIVLERRYEYMEEIQAYPGELRQLISNLLANALDAVQQNGKIMIHIFGSPSWRDDMTRGVRMLIGDTGPGISPENRRRIFEPFFTTKGEKGSGLGLWISAGIVSKHRGQIRIRSRTRLGRSGTCFSIFLPETIAAQAVSA